MLWIGAGVLALLAACHKGGPTGAYAVRDSSGVHIVTNPSFVPGDSACPRVDTVPAIAIGGAGADGPYDLLQVRSVRRLSNGGIAVLNGGTADVRFFDGAGRYVRTFGRKGSGPGEFQTVSGLLWFGADTLMVQDHATSRITLLSTAGALIETIALRNVSGAGLLGRLAFGGGLLGRLADGSLLSAAIPVYAPGAAPGRRREPTILERVSREGTVLDTLGRFPGPEVSVDGSSIALVPFGRSTYTALRDGSLFIADNAEYRVRVYAGGRRLERIIERAYVPVAPTAEAIERDKAQRERGMTDPRQVAATERMYDRDRLPAALPAHGPIAVDADGWLWVQAYAVPEGARTAWDVFDASGRLRCSLTLPSALTVHEIGHDFLLGVLTDPDGLEEVRVLGIRRGGLGAN